MKKLILTLFTITTVTSLFAQGTVVFYMRTALGTTHVWAPTSPLNTTRLVGFGINDSPSGSIDYAAAGMALIGANGPNGQFGYATTFAQLLAAPGSNMPEGSLTPQGTAVTFRSGAALGSVIFSDQTLGNVPKDALFATLEMVAWDNSSGLYSNWSLASVAWLNGLTVAGKSGTFNVANIGGDSNTPPSLLIPSFNLYFIPEPSTLVLAGLGAGAMLIWRRRR